ncbi:MAG: hypothetical protein CSA76_05370 [Spirochaetales bacterium]|nr:MAG: hypothetical protein CSA76_05370 [Spirochaetales bacterium]
MSVKNYLLVPLNRPGEGSGHLRRCRELEKNLKGRGLAAALLPDTAGEAGAEYAADTLLVLDRRSTSAEELNQRVSMGTPVLLDDDGSARLTAPFLIDTIPGRRGTAANLASPALMNLPPHERRPDASGKILVSFGGEDPADLTAPVCRSLVSAGVEASRISVTVPPKKKYGEGELPSGIVRLGAPEELKNLLSAYGTVVCSYGFTLWEALSAGCAVFTVDPAPYHASLSRECGFPGTGFVAKKHLEDAVRRQWPQKSEEKEHLEKTAEQLRERWLAEEEGGSGTHSLAEVLSRLEAPRPQCLVCRSTLPPVIARFPGRTYYLCPCCGMTGLYRFHLKSNEYGSAYFQEEYRQQYGRTYLEDFNFIRDMGFARLTRISRQAAGGGTLLDIGCAFGPFLSAAAEKGYECFGYDISPEAASYVRSELGFPAAAGAFPQENPAESLGVEQFDVVSLWYVIEHFPDLDEVLRSLSKLTKKGGVLAFSTPNGAGISARRSLKSFLERSPRDHYSIWTPASARRILALYGFRVYSVRVTGHHPERFPGEPASGSFLYRFWGCLSRLLGLGDTFEVYAKKEKELFQ